MTEATFHKKVYYFQCSQKLKAFLGLSNAPFGNSTTIPDVIRSELGRFLSLKFSMKKLTSIPLFLKANNHRVLLHCCQHWVLRFSLDILKMYSTFADYFSTISGLWIIITCFILFNCRSIINLAVTNSRLNLI